MTDEKSTGQITLIVRQATMQDMGQYKVVLENKKGTTQSTAKVHSLTLDYRL